ncbi:hypothetical protein [Zooshikella sp. RANM57]|uniref:hypothetical protein n=1 Tax=Zooshikella sp. RANM57 TaxID=3425863 RepID=UPI003D6EC7B2
MSSPQQYTKPVHLNDYERMIIDLAHEYRQHELVYKDPNSTEQEKYQAHLAMRRAKGRLDAHANVFAERADQLDQKVKLDDEEVRQAWQNIQDYFANKGIISAAGLNKIHVPGQEEKVHRALKAYNRLWKCYQDKISTIQWAAKQFSESKQKEQNTENIGDKRGFAMVASVFLSHIERFNNDLERLKTEEAETYQEIERIFTLVSNDCHKAPDLYPHCEIPAEFNEQHALISWSAARQNDVKNGPKRLNKADVVYIEEPGVRVRLRYRDNNKLVQHGYVIYWQYDDDNPEALTPDPDNTFAEQQVMLPIGIGIIDGEGYISSSLLLDNQKRFCLINAQRQSLSVEPQFTVKAKPQMSSLEDVSKQFENSEWLATHCVSDVDLQSCGIQSTEEQIIANLMEQGFTETSIDAMMAEYQKANQAAGGTDRAINDDIIVRHFLLEKTYGMLLYPIDRGPLVTGDLTRLTTLQAPQLEGSDPHTVAWKGKPLDHLVHADTLSPIADISLHTTLPEWDRRICQKIADYFDAAELFRLHSKPFIESATRLNMMSSLAEYQVLFPKKPHDNPKYLGSLYTLHFSLKKMAEIVKNQIYFSYETGRALPVLDHQGNPRDDLPCLQYFQDKMNAAAKALLKELRDPAFAQEIKFYQDYCQEHGPLHGPYTLSEPFWHHIYYTIAKGYAILADSCVQGDIETTECDSFLTYLINHDSIGEVLDEWENMVSSELNNGDASKIHPVISIKDKQYDIWPDELGAFLKKGKELYLKRNEQQRITFAVDTVFQWYKDSYKDTANTLFHNIPGPPNVAMVFLNVYSAYVARKVNIQGAGRNIHHLRLFVGLFRFFGVQGYENDNSKKFLIKKAGAAFFNMGHKVVTDKDIAAALHNDKDINDQIWGAARQKTYVKVYRTTIAIFNFTLALQNICAVFTDDVGNQQEQELIPFIFQVINDVVTLTDSSLKLYSAGVQLGLVSERALVNATLNRIAVYFLVVSTVTAASSMVEGAVDDQPISQWVGDLVDTVGNLSLLTGWLITAPGTQGVAGIAGLVSRAVGFIFGSATNPIGWFLLVLGSLWAVFSLIKDVIRAHQPELFK